MLPEKLVVFGQTFRPARSSSLDLKKRKEKQIQRAIFYRVTPPYSHPVNTVTSLLKNLLNTAICLWPVGHQINRVPLYRDFHWFLRKCYSTVLGYHGCLSVLTL